VDVSVEVEVLVSDASRDDVDFSLEVLFSVEADVDEFV
jgi:hypothetical protein